MPFTQRKGAEALVAAKVYWNICSMDEKEISKAMDMVGRCFKVKDGSVARLNKFLQFQKSGVAGEDGKTGTEDDLTDPLAEITMPENPERDKTYQQTMVGQPDTLLGYRTKGYVYLLWDKPKNALSEFKRAYEACPIDEKSIQATVNDITVGLKALNGTVLGSQEFLEYQKHGPNGPDGRPGTKDDLVNPLKDY